ncbi:hypothetical protein BCR39DRAFT_563092 [Naematelia encephala]|uniref:Guanine nucleotide exchange factor Vps9 n=1 Tax=Naematelia encephala TaxID=71784 RepID=A0A1Y2BL62_9TREE|nr:hypothetical protein BCR39DRAFT_563092 [Naematelia encephala]
MDGTQSQQLAEPEPVDNLTTPAPRSRPLTPGAPPPNPPGLAQDTPDKPGESSASGAARAELATPVANAEPNEVPFNFAGFLKDLRAKSAEPVAKYLKSFLSNFAKKPFTVNEQVKLIHDFLEFISGKMRQVEPWQSQPVPEFENALEAMEKLVMNRLYNYTFTPQLVPSQPITTDDLERDAVFAQRVRLFGWIRERHLDVPEGDASQGFLGFAEQELLKINHYKAPRDKMICILNCCKVIFGLIRHAHGAEAASADTFVPILIFVVLQANPENLLSNIEYINRFRSASKLQGEAGYYLSSLSGAISFIETMDASSLSNISREEFERNVEDAIQELPPSPSATVSRPIASEMSPFSATTEGDEPARPLSFPSLDNTRRFFQRTGTQVSDVVSRPLGAIGKIFDGIQKETPERRPSTPESPSQRFAQLEIDESRSRSGTPEVPIPDFQSTLEQSQEAFTQTRHANVQTLHQMFPDLDEDIAEAVLEGCGDDLGLAIDRLLEM